LILSARRDLVFEADLEGFMEKILWRRV